MRLSSLVRAAALACALPLALPATAAAQPDAPAVLDHVNGDMSSWPPIIPADQTFLVNSIGWSYTPTVSYSLGGILTQFFDAGPDRPVTVELFAGAPGGALLASGTFNSAHARPDDDLGDRRFGGVLFSAPVTITAGTTYFVGFRDVGQLDPLDPNSALGVNFTSWGTRLGAVRYGFESDGSDDYAYELLDGDAEYETSPMLRFVGPGAVVTTPEPTALLLLAGGLAALAAATARRRARARA
jgi:hypothetical protein